MRLYLSCPVFGGLLQSKTAANIMSCLDRAMKEKLISDYNLNYLGDSLVHRIRDRHANDALRGGWDKLFTIDSDIDFTWDDFRRIIISDKDVVGGSYPLKCFPVVVNFNPLPGKGRELMKTNRGYDYEAFEEFKKKYTDSEGYAEVTHLPTGFLCVKTEVLKKLAETADRYFTLAQETGHRDYFYHLYPSGVVESQLESEDWAFCRLASEAGYKIHFDTNVITGHIGNHTYRLGQVFGTLE